MQADRRGPAADVLHLTPRLDASSGGMGQFVRALLHEQGGRARAWSVDPGPLEAHLPVTRFRARPVGAALSPGLLRAVRRAPGHVLHQHGVWTGLTLATRLYRRTGRPTVVSPHGSLDPEALAFAALPKRALLAAVERANLQDADCLVATCDREAENLRRLGLTAPIAVVPAGVPAAWLDARGDRARFCARYGLPEDRRVLLFLSRLDPKKNLDVLQRAFQSSRAPERGWTLVVAGDGPPALRDRLRREAGRDVLYVGALHGQAKRDAYAAAQLFALPSLGENFGIVVAEALGAGVPVLVSRRMPWREAVDGGAGWQCEPDVDALHVALDVASAESPGRLAERGRAGRELVRERYLWPDVSARLDRVYTWLCSGGDRPEHVLAG